MQDEIKQQGISIQRGLQEGLPQVQGNSLLLQQVIAVLVSNAIGEVEKKFGKSGGLIIIKAQFEPENQHVCIHISDNGMGVPEEEVGMIFEPFSGIKQTCVGRGLVLYIVSNIIRKHRGNIEVSSKLNEGTAFKISLPAAVS